jgi:hypothetical protein
VKEPLNQQGTIGKRVEKLEKKATGNRKEQPETVKTTAENSAKQASTEENNEE